MFCCEWFVSLHLNIISRSVSRRKILTVSLERVHVSSLCASQCPRVDTHLNMHPHFCAVHVCIKHTRRKISSHPEPRAIHVHLIYNIKTRLFMGKVFDVHELFISCLFDCLGLQRPSGGPGTTWRARSRGTS